jgi:hypothetical protein
VSVLGGFFGFVLLVWLFFGLCVFGLLSRAHFLMVFIVQLGMGWCGIRVFFFFKDT